MDNLELYNKVREVPKEAKKTISAGRLRGMTDINPMWRIKKLTEVFGACGVGWFPKIVNKWLDTNTGTGEITANVEIELYYKTEDGWSMPIPGIGGSKLTASEKSGLYVSDECYKMAYTDAISVACKLIGMGADVYWDKDRTKYDEVPEEPKEPKESKHVDSQNYREKVIAYGREHNIPMSELQRDYNLTGTTTDERFKEVYEDLCKRA